MPRMIRSSVSPPSTGSVSMVRPSRRIVTESATDSTSFSLCEMRIAEMPWSRSSRIRSSSLRLSSSLRAAVGSSRMSSLTSLASALAISTSCCLPTPSAEIFVCGRSPVSPTRRSSRSVSRSVVDQEMKPPRPEVRSLPRKMFSAMDSCGISASSWWMMTMPRRSLARMSRKAQVSPSNSMSPS